MTPVPERVSIQVLDNREADEHGRGKPAMNDTASGKTGLALGNIFSSGTYSPKSFFAADTASGKTGLAPGVKPAWLYTRIPRRDNRYMDFTLA